MLFTELIIEGFLPPEGRAFWLVEQPAWAPVPML